MMSDDEQYKMRKRREEMRKSSREEAEAIVKLAGFTVTATWELANGYWPDSPNYDDIRRPWWLFLTEIGPVEIGWRKRVIAIDWDATTVRTEVTADEVTKGEAMVHAWSAEKAIEYLKALRAAGQAPSVDQEKKA